MSTTAKITKLTEEQIALLPVVRDEWIATCLSTAPVDRSITRGLMDRMYGIAGKPGPKYIIHLPSPLHVAWAVGMLRVFGDKLMSQAAHRAYAASRTKRKPKTPAPGDCAGPPIALQVLDDLRAQVSEQLHAQVIEQVGKQLEGTKQDSKRRKDIIEQAWAQLLTELDEQGGADAAHEDLLNDTTMPSVKEQTQQVALREMWRDFGQFEYWLSFYDFFRRIGINTEQLEPQMDIVKSCGWSALFWDWAFVSERPRVILRDEQARLHCEDGPALAYEGMEIHAIHGVRVPAFVVEDPASITVEHITKEENAEIRRVMISRYGQERFLRDSDATEIHRDDWGVLYRKEIPGDEPLVMVKVANSTPEPDGSFKDYFIRVDPSMQRAKQAVAWTFGMTEEAYDPDLET